MWNKTCWIFQNIIIFISDIPVIQPFSFPENVKLGQTVGVMCTVMHGQAPFKFVWQKNGNVIKDRVNINTMEKVSSLSIDPVAKTSSGNYTCIATNSFGRSSFSAFLRVKGNIKNSCFFINNIINDKSIYMVSAVKIYLKILIFKNELFICSRNTVHL